jgi:hypothetical protein
MRFHARGPKCRLQSLRFATLSGVTVDWQCLIPPPIDVLLLLRRNQEQRRLMSAMGSIVLRKSSGEHFGKIAENAFSRPR